MTTTTTTTMMMMMMILFLFVGVTVNSKLRCIFYWYYSECPKGFSGDCSQKCIPPAYGEDCQFLCNCIDGYFCHFADGCSQLDRTKTEILHTSISPIIICLRNACNINCLIHLSFLSVLCSLLERLEHSPASG